MTEQWEVVVGNIGTVFNAPNGSDAKLCFEEYKQMSINGYGRSAHEHVALFRNGEIVQKYNPTDEPEDKMTVEVCDALHKHGALTYKQITDICPSVESAQDIADLVAVGAVHVAYVPSEEVDAYYADKADDFNTPLQSDKLETLGGLDDESIVFKRGYNEGEEVLYVQVGRAFPITPGLYRLDAIDTHN